MAAKSGALVVGTVVMVRVLSSVALREGFIAASRGRAVVTPAVTAGGTTGGQARPSAWDGTTCSAGGTRLRRAASGGGAGEHVQPLGVGLRVADDRIHVAGRADHRCMETGLDVGRLPVVAADDHQVLRV